MKKYKTLREGLDETGTPDMKYYAFDWDDNIMYMPTKIIVKDEEGEEVPMSTEDFAEYRTEIGKEPFEYEGHQIVGFADLPFRYFTVTGDKNFIVDSMTAKEGPAWADFVEAINNGSIFSIITARGHTPSIMKNAVYNLIVSNHSGIDSDELARNLEKYRDLADEEQLTKKDMINEYLDLCKFYPVTYGKGSAANPEEEKVLALKEFKSHVKHLSKFIKKKAFLKNIIVNREPQIGFSDDDIRNVVKIDSSFKDDPDDMIKVYSTAGGVKKRFNNPE
jgi:hypothetical protein